MSEPTLSDFERAFAENYAISLRKDLAAIAAGSESKDPGIVGWQIYQRPHVKAYIESLLDEKTISAKETLKLISDTAQGNMSDYMFPVQRLNIPKVKRGLQELINHLQYEIEIESEFLRLAQNLSKEEREWSLNKIRANELEITRYDIELEKNPAAYRVVDGDPELRDEVELDLHAIVADKERGKIKSYKVTKDGIQIEMYPADAAQERMARVYGLYGKDNEQRKAEIAINIQPDESKLGE
jgi:hypothetical protein